MDLLAEVGGLGGAVAGTLSSFAVYIMMLFVFDLIGIIMRKYTLDKRMHNLDIVSKKLPDFRMYALGRIKTIKQEMEYNKAISDSENE